MVPAAAAEFYPARRDTAIAEVLCFRSAKEYAAKMSGTDMAACRCRVSQRSFFGPRMGRGAVAWGEQNARQAGCMVEMLVCETGRQRGGGVLGGAALGGAVLRGVPGGAVPGTPILGGTVRGGAIP
jgi:hypothetical protein